MLFFAGEGIHEMISLFNQRKKRKALKVQYIVIRALWLLLVMASFLLKDFRRH